MNNPAKIHADRRNLLCFDSRKDEHTLLLKQALVGNACRISELAAAACLKDGQTRKLVQDLVLSGLLEECGANATSGRPANLYRLSDKGMEVVMAVHDKESWLEGTNPGFLDTFSGD